MSTLAMLTRSLKSVYDIEAWVKKAQELGYTTIWLQGHSLGCSKIVYYLDQKDSRDIDGIILLSPADMIGLVHDPVGQKDHDVLYPEAKELVRTGKGEQLLSHLLWESIKLSATTYLNMFDDNSNSKIFCYADPKFKWQAVNKISVPVIAFTGTQDDGIVPVIDAYEAMRKLEEKLRTAPNKKTVVYEGGDHDFSGLGEKIVKKVISFIQNQPV